MTPVIFRKFNSGSVIAILPTILGTADYWTCASYMHIGQHSGCDPVGLIRMTKPATEMEYSDLLEELISIGYDDLKVYKRYNRVWQDMRKAALVTIK